MTRTQSVPANVRFCWRYEGFRFPRKGGPIRVRGARRFRALCRGGGDASAPPPTGPAPPGDVRRGREGPRDPQQPPVCPGEVRRDHGHGLLCHFRGARRARIPGAAPPTHTQAAPQHAYWGADESVNRPRWAGGGGWSGTPPPPNGVCCARRRVGAHPGGCRGPQAKQVEATGGTKDSGDTNPPSLRVSARANGHA